MEENKEIVNIFWYSMNHARYEQGQFIGVDMNYVVELMKIFKVKQKDRCIKGVVKLVNFVIDKNKEAKPELRNKINAF